MILDEVQSTAIDVFQKCDDLEDYLAGSQKLLDHAASYLDDLMFEEDFKACFDFVFDSFLPRLSSSSSTTAKRTIIIGGNTSSSL